MYRHTNTRKLFLLIISLISFGKNIITSRSSEQSKDTYNHFYYVFGRTGRNTIENG